MIMMNIIMTINIVDDDDNNNDDADDDSHGAKSTVKNQCASVYETLGVYSCCWSLWQLLKYRQ